MKIFFALFPARPWHLRAVSTFTLGSQRKEDPMTRLLSLCLLLGFTTVGVSAADDKNPPADAKNGFAWKSVIPDDCPCGSLVHDGIWYFGTYCLGPAANFTPEGFTWNWPNLGPMPGFHISRDLGRTWQAPLTSPEKPLFPEPDEYLGPVKMGAPHFVDFGKSMEHSPDGKAYLLGMGAEAGDPQPRPCLKAGPKGTASGKNEACAAPVRLQPRKEEADGPLKGVFERAFQQANGQPFAHGNLSWISADGRTLWLCYSANFSPGWNGVDLKINPPGGRYGLCLHEVRLLGPVTLRAGLPARSTRNSSL